MSIKENLVRILGYTVRARPSSLGLMAFEAAVATVEAEEEGGDTSAFEFLIKVVYNPHLSHYNQHFSPSLTMRGAGYDSLTRRGSSTRP